MIIVIFTLDLLFRGSIVCSRSRLVSCVDRFYIPLHECVIGPSLPPPRRAIKVQLSHNGLSYVAFIAICLDPNSRP